MSTPPNRLQFLDALRGVAVLLVVFAHAAHSRFPIAQFIDANYFQTGQAGVSLFFIISGYIIPKSLLASPSLKVFWVHRFFRLYPAYWACLLLMILLANVQLLNPKAPLNIIDIAANFTMLQGFVGVENAVNVFWSLKFEMAFYFLMTGLAMAGMMKRPFVVFMLYSAGTITLALGMHLMLHEYFAYGVFNLELMLLGWVLAEWHSQRLGGKYAVTSVVVGLGTTLIAAYTAFAGRTEELTVGTLSFVPMANAWLFSTIFFVLVLLTTQHVRWPRWLAWVGTVSYSAYLLHPLVLELSIHLLPPTALTVVVEFAASFAAAWICFCLVETPCIAYGKKVAPPAQITPAVSA